MHTEQALIDKAANSCGGLRRLADEIGEDPGFLSKIRSGKKPLSPGIAARLAIVAGMDARRAALEALVSQEKDRIKQQALAIALGVPVPPEPEPQDGLLHQIA